MRPIILVSFFAIIFTACKTNHPADLILLNGKIITVDQNFSIAEAVAVSEDMIIAVGSSSKIKKYANENTKVIDLEGKTVIPGINESHLHPEMAYLSEIEEEIPDVHTIEQLLDWIKHQTTIKEKGQWIIFPKCFSTRFIELRSPTLEEMDEAAPFHPVFLDGTYGGVINSAAMKVSGISGSINNPGLLRDEKTGRLTGFIRANAFRLLKLPAPRTLTYQEKLSALQDMLLRYNRYGITSLTAASDNQEVVQMYKDLSKINKLTTRIFQNVMLRMGGDSITKENVSEKLKKLGYITGDGDEWYRIGPLKIILDGGILTGTAYMREPWGDKAQDIFGIKDPEYRGVLNYTREQLLAIVSAANEFNWSFAAHSTGGGGVDLLLDVYEEVNKSKSIKDKRFTIIHGNFFTQRSIMRMKELDVYANSQPAWFYKDADAMLQILGEEKINTYHPYRSLVDEGVMVNFGSDHMVKWDANASINPYNPFLAMWSAITRKTERGTELVPSQAITREEALKMYTINNAYASFEESLKGSIETGKLADMAILTDDILTCPVDKIKEIESELTIVGGKIVYSAENKTNQ